MTTFLVHNFHTNNWFGFINLFHPLINNIQEHWHQQSAFQHNTFPPTLMLQLLMNHGSELTQNLGLSLAALFVVECGEGSLLICTVNLVLFSQTYSFHSPMSEKELLCWSNKYGFKFMMMMMIWKRLHQCLKSFKIPNWYHLYSSIQTH